MVLEQRKNSHVSMIMIKESMGSSFNRILHTLLNKKKVNKKNSIIIIIINGMNRIIKLSKVIKKKNK